MHLCKIFYIHLEFGKSAYKNVLISVVGTQKNLLNEMALLALYLIETPFDAFANRADPDQAVGSTLFTYGRIIRYDPKTSNFFVLCTNVKV